MKNRDLDDIKIDESTLMDLLEYPAYAFEIHKDSEVGVEKLRVRSSYLKEQAKLVRSKFEFYLIYDVVYSIKNRFLKDVATEKKLIQSDFNIETDPTTGNVRKEYNKIKICKG